MVAKPVISVVPDSSLVSAPAPEDKSLERHIGNVVRDLRLQQRLTIADVASQAQISRGMLSKIENGQASTSLDTLAKLSSVLGVSMAHLFRDYDRPDGGAQLVKSDAGMEVVRRGTKRGHTYQLLAYDKGPRKSFEPFLISMDDASEVFPTFEHDGTEFIHMLAGRLEYRHGDATHLLEPGDSLTFDGSVPHGPERIVEVPIRFITVIVYDSPIRE
jgi:transcriptional regulator with XRE-family HTH domain